MLTRQRAMTPDEVVWAKEQVAKGYTATSVARVLGRNAETVRRAVRGETHKGVVCLVDGLRPRGEEPESRPGEVGVTAGLPPADPRQVARWNENARRMAEGLPLLEEAGPDGAAEQAGVSKETLERAREFGLGGVGRAGTGALPPTVDSKVE